MHPILLRIPLPNRPLKLWWALVVVALLAVVYTAISQKRRERTNALTGLAVFAVAGICSFAFRGKQFQAADLPIYSYGVMLGLSLVVGWYLTLTLAERDGLDKERMANCYVVTALAAIVGSRVLYVVTNLDEFKTFADLFALRRGGLVAYGGFLGGFLGSWAYLSRLRIRLMPWADVAVPSLASGLMITRIGCYLFGCDFGKPLSETSPAFLQKLGTFPHWAAGTLEAGNGSPAYVRHLEEFHDNAAIVSQITRTNASLPVHPTQIYESLAGLALLALVLWLRKKIVFRGQIFFVFTFAYGFIRFLLEMLRDDVERGEYGPMMGEHVLVPGALLVLSVGFAFGMAVGIRDATLRTVARVLAFVPPVVAYIALRPPSFGASVSVQLSTSQWIAVLSGAAVCFFFARFWQEAQRNPALAMSLGPGAEASRAAPSPAAGEDADDGDEDEETSGSEPHAGAPPAKTRA